MSSPFTARASRCLPQRKIFVHSRTSVSRTVALPTSRPRWISRLLSSSRNTRRHISTTVRYMRDARRTGTIEYPVLNETDSEPSWEEIPQTANISLRPLFVAIAICAGSFCIADVLDRMSDADFLRRLRQNGSRAVADLQSATRQVQRQKLNETLRWLKDHQVPSIASQAAEGVSSWWYSLDDAKGAAVTIIGVNTVVFLAWQSRNPRVLRRMIQSFVHFPGRTSGYTLLTSVFSHNSFMHLAFNMLALYGFAHMSFSFLKYHRLSDYPNLENGTSMNITSKHHFMASFMTLGVVANLVPHYVTLLAARSPALMRSSLGPALKPQGGLGASGAVYGCMAVTAMAHPDIQISLIFLPMLPFKIGYGFPAVCAIDAIGILRGWRRFGHLVHLSGAAAGVGAYAYGPAIWYWGQQILHGGRIESNNHR